MAMGRCKVLKLILVKKDIGVKLRHGTCGKSGKGDATNLLTCQVLASETQQYQGGCDNRGVGPG